MALDRINTRSRRAPFYLCLMGLAGLEREESQCRSDIDRVHIAIAGTGQGGGIALAVARSMRDSKPWSHYCLFPATCAAAPALVSSGGRDAVCPADTIRAVFDRIPSVKSLFHDPELTHTFSETFYGSTWQWLDRWLPQR